MNIKSLLCAALLTFGLASPLLAEDECCKTPASAELPAKLSEAELEAWKKEPAYGKPIRVGYNGGLCLGTFGIAQLKGYYADEGLNTVITKYQGGSSAQGDALGTGKIDITGDHIATLLVPAINGVRMVFTQGIHTGCKSLYVLDKSDIKTTADLKDKYIAIPDGIGASDHNITIRLLAADGMDPTKDVKYKVVESGAAVMSMEKGEISAALLSDQFASSFEKAGTLRRLRSLTTDSDFERDVCCIHAVNLDFYKANPITVKKLNRAHERAKEFIVAHPDEAVELLQANGWANGDPDVAKAFFKTLHYNVSDAETQSTLERTMTDYKKYGVLPKDGDSQAWMDKVWHPQGQATELTSK